MVLVSVESLRWSSGGRVFAFLLSVGDVCSVVACARFGMGKMGS